MTPGSFSVDVVRLGRNDSLASQVVRSTTMVRFRALSFVLRLCPVLVLAVRSAMRSGRAECHSFVVDTPVRPIVIRSAGLSRSFTWPFGSRSDLDRPRCHSLFDLGSLHCRVIRSGRQVRWPASSFVRGLRHGPFCCHPFRSPGPLETCGVRSTTWVQSWCMPVVLTQCSLRIFGVRSDGVVHSVPLPSGSGWWSDSLL